MNFGNGEINIENVEYFLLTDGKWYWVMDDSFDIDTYIFGETREEDGNDYFRRLYQGGKKEGYVGFTATTAIPRGGTETICGPMSSIKDPVGEQKQSMVQCQV